MIIKKDIRKLVVSTKVTSTEYTLLQKAVVKLYQSHYISKASISRVIQFCLQQQGILPGDGEGTLGDDAAEILTPSGKTLTCQEKSTSLPATSSGCVDKRSSFAPGNSSKDPPIQTPDFVPMLELDTQGKGEWNDHEAISLQSSSNCIVNEPFESFPLGFGIDDIASKDGSMGWEIDWRNPLGDVPLEQVFFNEHHVLICGMTGLSGKTTLLEFIATSWKSKKVLAMITKKGEASFKSPNPKCSHVPIFLPFAGKKSRLSWVDLEKILGVAFNLQDSVKSIRPVLMEACIEPRTLEEIANLLGDMLANPLLERSTLEKIPFEARIPTGQQIEKEGPSEMCQSLPLTGRLNYSKYLQVYRYISSLLDELKKNQYSDSLALENKEVNVMDISSLPQNMQSLVMGSVAHELVENHNNTVLAIPEAWLFASSGKNLAYSRDAIEALVRMGIASGNYVCLDCQDMVGIDPSIRRHIDNIFVGKQQDPLEIERTLAAVPLPYEQKPRPDEIQTLGIGQFFAISKGKMRKIYSTPLWMSFDEAFDKALRLHGERQSLARRRIEPRI